MVSHVPTDPVSPEHEDEEPPASPRVLVVSPSVFALVKKILEEDEELGDAGTARGTGLSDDDPLSATAPSLQADGVHTFAGYRLDVELESSSDESGLEVAE